MATLEIKTFTDPSYTLTVKLSGSDYRLRLDWNDRAQAWFLDFGTLDRWLRRGIKVVACWPLLWRNKGLAGFPDGELIAWDPSPERRGATPGRFDLGATCRLLYVENDARAFPTVHRG